MIFKFATEPNEEYDPQFEEKRKEFSKQLEVDWKEYNNSNKLRYQNNSQKNARMEFCIMKYFNNFFTILYALILALIVFFVFKFTSLKTFTGTGFKLYIIFTVIGFFIVFMNTLYKINHKKNRKNK